MRNRKLYSLLKKKSVITIDGEKKLLVLEYNHCENCQSIPATMLITFN